MHFERLHIVFIGAVVELKASYDSIDLQTSLIFATYLPKYPIMWGTELYLTQTEQDIAECEEVLNFKFATYLTEYSIMWGTELYLT